MLDRLRRFTFGLMFLACCAGHADPMYPSGTLDLEAHSRDDTLTIAIRQPPATVNTARVILSRPGTVESLPATYTPAATGSMATVTASLTPEPTDANGAVRPLALGNYTVTVELDGHRLPVAKKLAIVPPGNPEPILAEFLPPSTDVIRPAYFEDSRTGPTVSATPTRVVDLVLRGSNFQAGALSADEVIIINHVHERVTWGNCKDFTLGKASAPVERQIIAEDHGDEELHLCHVPVPDNGEILVEAGFGDWLSKQQLFRVFSYGRPTVIVMSAVIAGALALLPLLLLSSLKRSYSISGQNYKLRLLFLDPQTDSYSLSKLQFYLWTVAAIFSYSYLFISRVLVQYATWPDVPSTLPGVIAVAAGTSIGSQVVTSTRGSNGSGAVNPSFADLVTSGGVVAPDRVQMLLWTIFGVAGFIVSVVNLYPGTITELPTIPDGLLYLMGLSSAGYLGGKLARKPGPVVNEIDVSPNEPDDVIAAGSLAAQELTPDFTDSLATVRGTLGKLTAPTGSDAKDAVASLAEAVTTAAAAQTPSDIDRLLASLQDSCATANAKSASATQAFATAADDATRAAAATDAATAQSAAAALQDFSADVTRAVAICAVAPMLALTEPPLIARVITIRGTNLSSEAMLEIDQTPLPFRMLLNSQGQHAPEVLVREDATPGLARMLRFSIDPANLTGADLDQFRAWFGSAGKHTFTLTNLDGQKTEQDFSLPPGDSQKSGTGP